MGKHSLTIAKWAYSIHGGRKNKEAMASQPPRQCLEEVRKWLLRNWQINNLWEEVMKMNAFIMITKILSYLNLANKEKVQNVDKGIKIKKAL